MPIDFQTQMSGWVLLTPDRVSGVVNHSDVIEAVGNPPVSLVQLPDIAIADFSTLQVSYIEAAPQRFNLSITGRGTEPIERVNRVAKAAFHHALASQDAVAMGLNFVRTGSVSHGDAGPLLMNLLNPQVTRIMGEIGHPLTSAGIKLMYEDGPWTVTMSFEPSTATSGQIAASINFNIQMPPRADVDNLVDDAIRLYSSFVQVLNHLGEENAHVIAH